VKSVDEALKTPASELMSAASRPATTRPRRPTGITACTSSGKAACAVAGHDVALASTSGLRARHLPAAREREAIMPGMMKMKTGSSLRNAAKIVPRRASRLVRRAERALHDVLVGAPVPQPDDRRAEEHARATGSWC
jgi:hypothetical protein